MKENDGTQRTSSRNKLESIFVDPMELMVDFSPFGSFSVEKELRDKGEFDELIDLLKRSGIPYKIVEPDDPRKKYTYYRKCGYPYSPMRVYLKTEKQFWSHQFTPCFW